MRRAETITAIGLLLLGLILIRQATHLEIGWSSVGPGAGFFPFWLSVGVTIAAAAIVLQAVRAQPAAAPDEAFIPPTAWKPLLITFLPMAAVVALINYLGIYLGGLLYLGGYMRLVGRFRWPRVLGVSILVPLVLFFIFERWFLLPMPKGVVLEYFLYER